MQYKPDTGELLMWRINPRALDPHMHYLYTYLDINVALWSLQKHQQGRHRPSESLNKLQMWSFTCRNVSNLTLFPIIYLIPD
jgi:hypothetical protein